MDDLKFVLKNEIFDISLLAITETNFQNSIEARDVNEFNIDGYNLLNTIFNVTHCRGIFCYVKSGSAYSHVNLNSCFE